MEINLISSRTYRRLYFLLEKYFVLSFRKSIFSNGNQKLSKIENFLSYTWKIFIPYYVKLILNLEYFYSNYHNQSAVIYTNSYFYVYNFKDQIWTGISFICGISQQIQFDYFLVFRIMCIMCIFETSKLKLPKNIEKSTA